MFGSAMVGGVMGGMGGGGMGGGAMLGGTMGGMAPQCAAPPAPAPPAAPPAFSFAFGSAPPAPPCVSPPPAAAAASDIGNDFLGDMFGCAAPAALVPTEAAACFAPPTTRACTGAASAARVSYGARHDTWHGLIGRAQTPSRHESERLTVTVVLYNIVVGGVPSEADVLAAVDDLERLYAACRASS